MRRRTFQIGLVGACIAALSLVGVSGAALPAKAKQYGKIAAKDCAKQKHALGSKDFGEIYGKPAMPNCIGVTRPEIKKETRNASRECRAERADIGVEAFRAKYGTNRNKRNAFGKCVSGKRRSARAEERQDIFNAARECKAERDDVTFPTTHEEKTFAEFYGTNADDSNAFGKCVSGKAQADD